MKKRLIALACLILMLAASVAMAQGEELQLVFNRNMGFALGNQIQGSFELAIAEPADMTSVTYLIDGKRYSALCWVSIVANDASSGNGNW